MVKSSSANKVTEKIRQKLKYGAIVHLGSIEREVLAATPDTAVGNNFAPAEEIASVAGLTTRQTYDALRRLSEKGYVDCVKPFDDQLTTWTSYPFFKNFPGIAEELFPDHKTPIDRLWEELGEMTRKPAEVATDGRS